MRDWDTAIDAERQPRQEPTCELCGARRAEYVGDGDHGGTWLCAYCAGHEGEGE